jgi:superfamily II DNA helicase RecQ
MVRRPQLLIYGNAQAINVTEDSLRINGSIIREIEQRTYKWVLMSPERLLEKDGPMKSMLRNPDIRRRLKYLVVGEFHYMITLGDSFRTEYARIKRSCNRPNLFYSAVRCTSGRTTYVSMKALTLLASAHYLSG